MKSAAFLVFILMCALLRGQAPEGLSEKAFSFEEFRVGPGLPAIERAVVLRRDGTFSFLFSAMGLGSYNPWRYGIVDTPGGGTYQYTRTGAASGTLEFGQPIGRSLNLSFSTDSSGNVVGTYPTERGGSVLAIRDIGDSIRSPVGNVAVRGNVAAGKPLIAGFVVPGQPDVPPRHYLVRVVGPSLTQFNVSGVWNDPDFVVHKGATPIASTHVHYADWQTHPRPDAGGSVDPGPGLRNLFTALGAFPLLANSKDAVEIVWLTPGAYTVVAQASSGDPGGETLIEVYALPL